MSKAVIENMDQFIAFLAAQPLCRWCATKQHEIDSGVRSISGLRGIHPPPKKSDNAELAEALSSMA